jgi:hypothetical protein
MALPMELSLSQEKREMRSFLIQMMKMQENDVRI